jgi:hypothetical protein
MYHVCTCYVQPQCIYTTALCYVIVGEAITYYTPGCIYLYYNMRDIVRYPWTHEILIRGHKKCDTYGFNNVVIMLAA